MIPEAESSQEERPRRGPRLLDLLALTVGYGLAALLIRAFWPTSGQIPSVSVGVALGVLYLWLGLAMAGPLILLLDRRTRSRPGGPPPYTWAEMAWLLIGSYWVALAVLVVPTRMEVSPFLGALPVVAAIGLRLFGGAGSISGSTAAWTHRVGVALLFTWVPAWADLVLLSRTLF
jgi:hypothetical protein